MTIKASIVTAAIAAPVNEVQTINVTDDGDLYAVVADGGSVDVAVLETGLTA